MAAIAGLALIVILRCVTRDHWFFEASFIIVGILGVVLVFTLPICVLTLLGHQLVMTLAPLVPTSRQRAKWREMRQRPEINDKEFYQRFYGDSGIPEEIPLRLRGLYAEQLGISRLLPHDRATDFDDELDFGDLLFAVAEEFSIDFSEREARELAARARLTRLSGTWLPNRVTKSRRASIFIRVDPNIAGKALHRRRVGMFLGLLVAGLVVIGLGIAVGRLDEVVPGLALAMKIAGIGFVILA